jgi:hypothetical protein
MKAPTIGDSTASAPGVGSPHLPGLTSSEPRSGQYRIAIGPHSSALGTADSHPTSRQRGDGSRPSGNSSGTNVSTTGAAPAQTQVVSHAMNGPPGTDPGAVHKA